MEYDVFISYSREDLSVVEPLVKDIEQKAGVKCWIDWNGIETGTQFEEVIIKAIDSVDIVIFFISENSISSQYARMEVNYAYNTKKKVVPIVLDGGDLRGWFLFKFGSIDYIDINQKRQYDKLIQNLQSWCGTAPILKQEHNFNDKLKITTETEYISSKPTEIESVNNEKDRQNKTTSIFAPKSVSNLSKSNYGLNRKRISYIVSIFALLGFLICWHLIYKDNPEMSAVKEIDSISDLKYNSDVINAKEIDSLSMEDENAVRKSVVPDDFILVPSGTLYRYNDGYDRNEFKDIYKDVPLDAFYICTHEVTQEEFERIMGYNPSQIKGSKIPVNTVHFIDAIKYCNARSVAEGFDGFYTISDNVVSVNSSSNGYRLPNKYEWAYAARKDERTKTKYASGNDIKDIAWYGGNSNYTLHEICTKSPNQRGIYDMNGNVSEWLWEKDFNGFNCQIGSDFMTYISFGESDVVGSSYCSEENGFRVILITKGQDNSNIENQLTIKPHIKERHSFVEYKRKQDKEDE